MAEVDVALNAARIEQTVPGNAGIAKGRISASVAVWCANARGVCLALACGGYAPGHKAEAAGGVVLSTIEAVVDSAACVGGVGTVLGAESPGVWIIVLGTDEAIGQRTEAKGAHDLNLAVWDGVGLGSADVVNRVILEPILASDAVRLTVAIDKVDYANIAVGNFTRTIRYVAVERLAAQVVGQIVPSIADCAEIVLQA